MNRCACRCANRYAQVRKQVGFLYLHLHGHPFTQSFILTCSFLRATFPPKLALCVPMFTYKANFGGKVGLKNEQVKMNNWVNGWTCKCIYRVATCAVACALTCSVTCSLVRFTRSPVQSLAQLPVYPLAPCAFGTCALRGLHLEKPCLRTLQNS